MTSKPLVERLRKYEGWPAGLLTREAADEIERLTAELALMKNNVAADVLAQCVLRAGDWREGHVTRTLEEWKADQAERDRLRADLNDARSVIRRAHGKYCICVHCETLAGAADVVGQYVEKSEVPKEVIERYRQQDETPAVDPDQPRHCASCQCPELSAAGFK